MEDIERFFAAFDQVESAFKLPKILPGSDSASDNELMPGWSIAVMPPDLLASAIDHLHSLRRLSGQHDKGYGQWSARAPWTLLRSALEMSSQAIWLICENDESIRMERFLRLWYEDRLQLFAADALTLRKKDRPKIQDVENFDKAFHDLFVRWDTTQAHNRIRQRVNIAECIQEAAEFSRACAPDVATLLWKVASGYAHGRPWAWQQTGRVREVLDEHGLTTTQGGLDFPSVVQLIAVVVVTIQYADCLIKERAGHINEFTPVADMVPPRLQRLDQRVVPPFPN